MIRINNIHLYYRQHGVALHALRGVSLDINPGDYIALVGPSGSGKSSLIAAVTGLIFPSEGDIFIDRFRINRISRNARAKIRAKYCGIIFQFSEMPGRFTIRENLYLSWLSADRGKDLSEFEERLELVCAKLDIHPLLEIRPGNLSGGQLQKTAIARAIIKDAPIILADEPSGDLDPDNVKRVRNVLQEEIENGKSILMVTHDAKLASDAHTIYELRDGQIHNVLK